MAVIETDLDVDFAKLDVKCTSTKCDKNLHCFKPKKPTKKRGRTGENQSSPPEEMQSLPGPGEEGRCRSCGAQLVDWVRIHKRDLADASYTMQMLKLEMWRRYNWWKPIDERALNRARRRGRSGLRDEAVKVIQKKLAPSNPPFDGRQTPREGNVIYYAQHATGTCCRECLHYWYGIKQGRELTDEQIAFVSAWIQRFIGERLPDLLEAAEKVPPIRKKKLRPVG